MEQRTVKSSTKMIPIPSAIVDPYYRYTRHQASLETFSHGEVFSNIHQIARELDRAPIDLVKWIQIHCGTEVKIMQEGKKGINKAIIKSSMSAKHLEAIIELFIKQFVLCDMCLLPETKLRATKDQIKLSCRACGNEGIACDQDHPYFKYLSNTYGVSKTSVAMANQEKKQEKRKAKIEKQKLQALTDDQEDSCSCLQRHL